MSSTVSAMVADTHNVRRLVAVMHMDMVSYSRLIGLDVTGTLSRLKSLRHALIEPAVEEQGGRIMQTAGDSFLVVFDSIDGAMASALKIQRLVPAYDGAQPPERQIRFRVGIEIGDVIADGTDLHGDGVNVAVRLQSVGPPGGICVSRVVRDHVRLPPELKFESLGPLSLKNIARTVEAFSLQVAGASSRQSAIAPSPSPSPSLVILPFESLGGDGSNDWLADAITDDLTTELSRYSGTSVVARNTGHAVDGKPTDIQQIGRAHNARYALHGSVRNVGRQIWINAQLIDADTGTHIHADRFACVTSNYDEAISRVVRTVKVALITDRCKRTCARPIAELDLTDLLVHGQAALLQPLSREAFATAQTYFELVLTIDARSVEAQSMIAHILVGNIIEGWSDSPVADQQRAEQLLSSAMRRDTNNSRAHGAMALLRRLQCRLEDSQVELEMAIALDPHNPHSFWQLGLVLTYMGRLDAAIGNIEKGICVSPREPMVALGYSMLGHCRLLQGNLDEALSQLRKAHARNPDLYYNHLFLAATLALSGQLDQARLALTAAMELKPKFHSLEALWNAHPWALGRKYQDLVEPTLNLGLRQAGMPDH